MLGCLVYAVVACLSDVSVRLSVASLYCVKTAERKIAQTALRDIAESLHRESKKKTLNSCP